MENKLVSVIVPVFNVEKYLVKCINSVLNQTYNNIEVILINDGSTDKSGEICDSLALKDKRVKVIHKVNEGVSIARNIGLDISKGDYIFFVDSDDYIDHTAINDMMKYTDNYEIVKLSHRLIENGKKLKIISNDKLYKRDEYMKEVIEQNLSSQIWGHLINKAIVKELRFDENTSCMEDSIFIINCVLKSKHIKCIDSSYYNYIVNPNGITCSTSRILKNIKDYIYSIDNIKKIIDNSEKQEELNNRVAQKKIEVIESEIAKITKKEELILLFKDKEISRILIDINNNSHIKLVYRIFSNIILSERYNIILIYLEVRRCIKKIVKKIRCIYN